MQNALQTESDRFSMTTYPAEVPYRTKLIEIWCYPIGEISSIAEAILRDYGLTEVVLMTTIFINDTPGMLQV